MSECGLVLYGTSACHLCELAEALLLPWVAQGIAIEWIDIAEDDQLLVRYGSLIPVLQREDGQQLFWPFDAPMIAGFLSVGGSPA